MIINNMFFFNMIIIFIFLKTIEFLICLSIVQHYLWIELNVCKTKEIQRVALGQKTDARLSRVSDDKKQKILL